MLLVLLLVGMWSPGTASAAVTPTHPAGLPVPHRPIPRSLVTQEGQWFTLTHFGSRLPAPQARQNALAEAAKLPRTKLGSTSGTWVPLGPQPINTANCVSCTIGPYGATSGRITALAVNPTNSNDLWAGAADGGLWHSTNGGTTWTPVTDGQPTLSIGAIAIDSDSGSPYTIYVGTGEANQNQDAYWGLGLLKSTDGGQNWQQLGSTTFGGMDFTKLAVLDPDPNNGNAPTLLAAVSFNGLTAPVGGANILANAGIWRSTNLGSTWTQVLADTTSPTYDAGTDVVFDPAHPGTAFAGLGNIFSKSAPGFTSRAGVYKSTNSGATWTQLSGGVVPTGNAVERVSLGISTDGQHVYAALTGAGGTTSCAAGSGGSLLQSSIFVSTDNGAHWSAKDISPVQGMATDDGECQWWYDSVVGVDPTDSSGQTAFVGGVDLWVTPDGGASWANLTNVYNQPGEGTFAHVHPDMHALAFFGTPMTNSSFYLGNDGGVWRSVTGGDSFTNLNSGGLNITQFYSGSIGEKGSHAQLYGGAQDNGEIQYPGAPVPGATTWQEVYDGDGGATVVDFTNNALVYEETASGQVNKSSDGGSHWQAATSGMNLCASGCDAVNFVMPLIMAPSNHLELFAGTDVVYRTTDGAGSWTAISPVLDPGTCGNASCGMPLSALAVAPSNDQYIYVGDDAGHIFVTTNGGANWSSAITISGSTHGVVTGLAVDPTNPRQVYATFANFASGAGQHVFLSTNTGATWSDISAALPNIPFESVVVLHTGCRICKNPVIVGSDAGVFTSTNAGKTWSQLGANLPNAAINKVFANATGSRLFVATHGRGMWEYVLSPAPSPSETDWPTFGFDVQHTRDNPNETILNTTNAHNLSVKWSVPTGSIFGSSPAVVNGILYVGSSPEGSPNGILYALNASDGTQLWSFPAGSGIYSSPAVANGIVYFGAVDGTVYALQASNGAELWSFLTGPSISSLVFTSSPSVVNGIVYIGSMNGTMYALNAATGALIWSYTTQPIPIVNVPLIDSSPAVVNGIVYFGAYDGNVYALDAMTGSFIWAYQTGSAVESSPTVVNGIVYVGSDDASLYALNATTGALLWSQQTGASVVASPAVANGIVYVGSDDSSLYAFNATTGALLWSFATGSIIESSPAVANGVVYFGSEDNKIYALGATTGTLLWSDNPGTLVAASVTVVNGMVYIGSIDSNLYAFFLVGAGTPA